MDGKVEALRLMSNLLTILNPKATRELQNKPIFPIIKDPYVPVKLPQVAIPPPDLTHGSYLHGGALC